jgi:hypothetical protein
MKPFRGAVLTAALLTAGVAAWAQSERPAPDVHRMEIALEQRAKGEWHTVPPGKVMEQGDVVRFRFHANFDGYLYVMDLGTSGKYQQLFPADQTGQDNRVEGGKDYRVPATSTAFRVSGPEGYDVVYWLVTPARLTDGAARLGPPPMGPGVKSTMVPRCDGVLLKARGDCVDNAAGPRMVPRDEAMPENLSKVPGLKPRELIFLRQDDTAVISSPDPLTGPVLYEFRLAHR